MQPQLAGTYFWPCAQTCLLTRANNQEGIGRLGPWPPQRPCLWAADTATVPRDLKTIIIILPHTNAGTRGELLPLLPSLYVGFSSARPAPLGLRIPARIISARNPNPVLCPPILSSKIPCCISVLRLMHGDLMTSLDLSCTVAHQLVAGCFSRTLTKVKEWSKETTERVVEKMKRGC